ncbi:MAG TPA: hypothetical protein IGS52_14385 [Oscillatoriaceae cyanobacterium M33_DOE_052]|nr:hypothetical protein [Oscillatoriaceae cyanobacterium M33_DOE_052]
MRTNLIPKTTAGVTQSITAIRGVEVLNLCITRRRPSALFLLYPVIIP